MFKILCKFQKHSENFDKKFLTFGIISLELVEGSPRYYDENTCRRDSFLQETVVGFQS